ncbi:uncharacterized protein LOC128712373 [Anopheles marshallii]|uniref:uncharacterized protein LOC128712373 n=1 Tax=Anopheles marshallii TaxID=1521116 RepID=UPI00237BC106|nr:uncharacterized protein LOC128712373 [Anopheles marshallii]
MSDLTYTKTLIDHPGLFLMDDEYLYSCNFIPVGSAQHWNIYNGLRFSTSCIFFYPVWISEGLQHPNVTYHPRYQRKGYEVMYDHNNTMEIKHWNFLSNQTTTLDAENIAVPDDMRDLFGYELVMLSWDIDIEVLTFDGYFLELIASRRNATASQQNKFTDRISIFVVRNAKDMEGYARRFIIPGPGITYMAIVTQRAKAKSIISVLVDPFDLYIWSIYVVLVLTIATSVALFGELLGRQHFVEIVLELIMISLAGPSRAYGGSFENRIITMFCLMGIVLVSSYQSLVISFMSFARYHPEINTLADVEQRCILSDTEAAHELNLKTYRLNQFPPVEQICYIDYVRDNEQLSIAIYEKFINDAERVRARIENMRHARVRFYEYPIFYLLTFNCREFRTFVKFYAQAIIESGIYEFYYRNRSQSKWHYAQETFVNRTVRLTDLSLLWYAYALGSTISLLCFMAEKMFLQLSRRFYLREIER